MKLIKQKKLFFSEGNSDKVYEVDLCESQDLFVVNFRYGRRGNNLREGTKTVFPVSYEEAEIVFNKLIESKEKKGYSATLGETAKETVENKDGNTVRTATILKYLEQAINGSYTRNWKVSKIIARVGVLQIKEAIPQVAKFINSSDEFEQYNAIAVLADFNEANYLAEITTIFKEQKFTTISGRIACTYILKYGNTEHKKVVQETLVNYISKEELNSLTMQFVKGNTTNAMLLYYAYINASENDVLREELYKIIERIPLKVNTFKSIRYIYRTASVTNDTLFFALLSKRIAVSGAGYTSEYFYINDDWVNAHEEKKEENPRIAFSGKTKEYFNKITYKKVYELSTRNQDSYILYAKELLCSLSDKEDNVRENTSYEYSYNQNTGRYETEKRCYPKYHQFSALMYVLYGNSPRFQQQKNKWFYVEQGNQHIIREEILVNVWNEKPNEVLYILANAKSDVAVEFALKIIDENPHFLEAISDAFFQKLITHKHPKVIELMVAVLEKKYASIQPEEAVLIHVLSSKNEKAITLGLNWLKKYESSYLSNADVVAKLIQTDEVLVATYLKTLYQESVPYQTIISIKDINSLFKEPSIYSNEFLIAVNELIGNTFFGKLLSTTPEEKIVSLSASSFVMNKLFAINLAKHNSIPAYELFKESYIDYIESDEEVLRKAGIELLAHFPDAFLLEKKKDIVRFCFSEYAEVRKAIHPTIERLIKLDSSFKGALLKQLLAYLKDAESYEGLHQNCYEILIEFYGTDLNGLSEEEIIELILSKYEFAQKLGTPLFEKRISLSSLSMTNLVRLAHSDVFSIREALQKNFKENKARVNYELETALLIFNTNWQDVIDWACIYFEEAVDVENWTVEVLLYTCDHVKEQVQALGRRMVTKHFSEEKGLPLLTSLQEHPTKGMQFFVTNYLDEYASDNISVILKLESYFKTTLFYINTHRATKSRVYAFLEKEAIKHKEVAVMTVRILTAILDTKTIKDKNKIIDILLTISETYTDVEVPLLIQ